MATMVLTNAYCSIASNNLSSSVRQIELSYESETVDDTTMGDTTRSAKGSLLGWSANVTFAQDFAAAALDSILFPLVGTVVAIELRPVNTTVSTSNPKFTGNALVKSYKPMSGSVGDFGECQIELVAAKGSGTATLSRATS